MQTHIDLLFADGMYRCALGLEQIHEIQQKCKAGIGTVYARVLQGRVSEDITVGHPAYAAFHVDDLIETVRQGLIGGGQGVVDGQEVKVGPLRANELVERYFMPLPLVDQWNMAAAILYAKIEGYEPPPDAPTADTPPAPKKKSAPLEEKEREQRGWFDYPAALVDCAMMGGIQPSEAKRLTYWEFTAMRHTWNERHKRPGDDDGEPAAPPTESEVREAQAELYELGIAGRSPN